MKGSRMEDGDARESSEVKIEIDVAEDPQDEPTLPAVSCLSANGCSQSSQLLAERRRRQIAKDVNTGALCRLDMNETAILIDLYHSHPAVWDMRSADYRNKSLKSASWKSIWTNFSKMTRLDCTVENVQAKVTALRNHFTRELRKERDSKHSGGAADQAYKSCWPFFTSLLFLVPVITIVKQTIANFKTTQLKHLQDNRPTANSCLDLNETGPVCEDDFSSMPTSTDRKDAEGSIGRGDLDTEGQGNEQEEEEPEEHEWERDFPPRRRRRKEPEGTNLRQVLIDYLANKKRRQTEREKEDDSDLLWAKNLARNLQEIRNERVKKLLKLDIADMVSKAMREDLNTE